MTISIPQLNDLVVFVVALQHNPVGALVLLFLVFAVIFGIHVARR